MGSRKKIIIVGDKGCGKTSFYNCISGVKINSDYKPTLSQESCQKNISINGQNIRLWDTIGDENNGFGNKRDSKALRKYYYGGAYMVLVCYSVDDRNSLGSVEKYLENVKEFCKKARIVLVAMKIDQRENRRVNTVSLLEGKEKARKVKALKHLECSSLQDDGVMQLLGAALKAVRTAKEDKKRTKCVIQ